MLTTVHAFMYFTLLAALDTSAHRFGEGRVTPERTEGWHTYSDSGLSLSQTDHDQHQEVESFCSTDILPTFTVSSHLFPGCPFSFALPTWHQFVCGWVGVMMGYMCWTQCVCGTCTFFVLVVNVVIYFV